MPPRRKLDGPGACREKGDPVDWLPDGVISSKTESDSDTDDEPTSPESQEGQEPDPGEGRSEPQE